MLSIYDEAKKVIDEEWSGLQEDIHRMSEWDREVIYGRISLRLFSVLRGMKVDRYFRDEWNGRYGNLAPVCGLFPEICDEECRLFHR